MARDRTLGLKLRAIDKMSTTLDRITKRFPKLTRSINRATATTKIFNAQTKRMRANLMKAGTRMKSFGRGMTTFVTLPLLAAGAAGVKMFGDFQQGLRGVEKTTGLSRAEVAKLGKVFDQLSTEIPVTTAEMLELAQAGGQLGVTGSANLEKFTVTMAKLGRASDVAGEDGAKSIARILTVTGDGIGKIERFSSALVDLGNNAAAGEQEILEVATRVAGQIGRFDVASDKVLGISTALKALGKKAEESGSVVGRAFDAIDQAIRGGGDKMKVLSKLTGIAGKDLKQVFEKDAAGVFQKFIVGLNKVDKAEGNQVKTLRNLGLQGVRINSVLLSLAKSPEVLTENMDRASKAFRENTALQKEFQVQTESFNSEMINLTNTFTSLLRMIGESLAPTVKFLGAVFKDMLNFLRDNPTIRALVIVFGALAAVFGPLIFIVGAFLTILPALLAGLAAIGVTGFAALAPFLLIPLAIAAVIAIGVVLFKNWEAIKLAFSKNIFGKTLIFIGFMVQALGKLIALILFAVDNFTKFGAIADAVKDVFGFGEDIAQKSALGPPKGAQQFNQGKGPLRDPVNGQIGVTFANAPAGTKVTGKAEGQFDFNLGFVGGVQ